MNEPDSNEQPNPEIIKVNIPAFTRTETRDGIPLNYVAEKLAHALFAAHVINQAIDEEAIIETHNPENPRWRQKVTFKEELKQHAWEIFRQAMKSFLALHNMLSIADQEGIQEKLLAMDSKEFQAWLDYIYREGSVT